MNLPKLKGFQQIKFNQLKSPFVDFGNKIPLNISNYIYRFNTNISNSVERFECSRGQIYKFH